MLITAGGGMRHPEDRGKPCIGGWLKDGIEGFYGRATSLQEWCFVWSPAAVVLWMGLAIHPQMIHTQRRDWRAEEVVRAVSAVSVDMCFLTVCATIRALVVGASGHLRVISSLPHHVVHAGTHSIGQVHSPD
jgi:hypothetical protein